MRSSFAKMTNLITSSTRINTFSSSTKFLCDSSNFEGCRHNFHPGSEAGINKQINEELFAGYTYLTMAEYFGRHNVALIGFKNYFENSAEEERSHAKLLIEYMNLRGGNVKFDTIAKPSAKEWETGLNALKDALKLEHKINEGLLQLHKLSTENSDVHLSHFLEHELLDEQRKSLYEISKLITEITRAGPHHGEHHHDRILMKKYKNS